MVFLEWFEMLSWNNWEKNWMIIILVKYKENDKIFMLFGI